MLKPVQKKYKIEIGEQYPAPIQCNKYVNLALFKQQKANASAEATVRKAKEADDKKKTTKPKAKATPKPKTPKAKK